MKHSKKRFESPQSHSDPRRRADRPGCRALSYLDHGEHVLEDCSGFMSQRLNLWAHCSGTTMMSSWREASCTFSEHNFGQPRHHFYCGGDGLDGCLCLDEISFSQLGWCFLRALVIRTIPRSYWLSPCSSCLRNRADQWRLILILACKSARCASNLVADRLLLKYRRAGVCSHGGRASRFALIRCLPLVMPGLAATAIFALSKAGMSSPTP